MFLRALCGTLYSLYSLLSTLYPSTPMPTPERLFYSRTSVAQRKALGQFFTPPAIAEELCRWATALRPRTLLDPAVGAGVLVRTALRHVPNCCVTGVDVDPTVLDCCRQGLPEDAQVALVREDFLTWTDAQTFDAIVANPPYLRHHDLAYEHDIFHTIGRKNDVKLSRLTNIYALFLLEICRRLKPGGRAAVIIPGEWLNANFGAPIKEFLVKRGLLRRLVYFSHAELVFDDALTTACLLFLERPAAPQPLREIETWFVPQGTRLDAPSTVKRRLPVRELPASAKWSWTIEHGLRLLPRGLGALGGAGRNASRDRNRGESLFSLDRDPNPTVGHCSPTSHSVCGTRRFGARPHPGSAGL